MVIQKKVRLVVDDLKAMLTLRDNLRRYLFTTADWIPSFQKTQHKTFMGRALYEIALCIDELEKRIVQLTTNEEIAELNQPPIDLYAVTFDTALARKQLFLEKANGAIDYVEAYLLDSDGLRDEPSVLTMQNVQIRLSALVRMLGDYDATFPFQADEQLVRGELPSRDPSYTVVPAAEARINIPEEEMLVWALHFISLVVEISAIEICSTLMVENREMPWAFYLDMTRQCNDEARHFEILNQKVEELGGYAGKYPIHVGIWEFAQRGTNLAEKLAIQQVVQEGHGLDANIVNINNFMNNEMQEYAAIFDYINVDEADHVRIGCRWLLHECRNNRVMALEIFNQTYENLLEMGFKPGFTVQEKERLWVGMTAEQIQKAKDVVCQILMERQKVVETK